MTGERELAREAEQFSPLTLAFVGDAVYGLLARRRIVAEHGSMPSGKLHSMAVELVRAGAQAAAYAALEPLLDESELAVYRRGRNASGATVPRSASAAEYRSATGMEALFGWLYLTGRADRAEELFAEIPAPSPAPTPDTPPE